MNLPYMVVFKTFVFFGLLWFLWFVLIKDLVLDFFRHKLFGVRDKLFRITMNESMKMNFSHPLYKALRNQFNDTIRFGHKIDFLEMTIFAFLNKTSYPKSRIVSKRYVDITEMISRIKNIETKNSILKIVNEYENTVIFYMLISSFSSFFCGILIFLYLSVRNLCKHLTKKTVNNSKSRVLSFYSEQIDYKTARLLTA